MSKDEERYDVSQHDGITQGKRAIGEWAEGAANYAEATVGWLVTANTLGAGKANSIAWEVMREEDAVAIQKLPEILDALKKAYEKIDRLEAIIEATIDLEFDASE